MGDIKKALKLAVKGQEISSKDFAKFLGIKHKDLKALMAKSKETFDLSEGSYRLTPKETSHLVELSKPDYSQVPDNRLVTALQVGYIQSRDLAKGLKVKHSLVEKLVYRYKGNFPDEALLFYNDPDSKRGRVFFHLTPKQSSYVTARVFMSRGYRRLDDRGVWNG